MLARPAAPADPGLGGDAPGRRGATTSPISEPISSSEAPVAVAGRGVDERAAGLGERDELLAGLVLVGVAPPGQGAEPQPGHLEAGATQVALLHGGNAIEASGSGLAPRRARRSCCVRSARRSRRPSTLRSRPPVHRLLQGRRPGHPRRASPSSCRSRARATSDLPGALRLGRPGRPAFTAVIQIGTELAVLIYFRKDIWRIGSAWVRSPVSSRSCAGTLDSPDGLVHHRRLAADRACSACCSRTSSSADFRNLWIIGVALIVLGVVMLGIADRRRPHRHAARRT